ncbi:MAG: glycosyltransferase [Deltaproteobacteria bacterium]|nr:glycosyltransferase [Deltaproteobacteria bacterium]
MEDGISIIIPTFNGGEVFLRSLEKIGSQEYPGPVQLIVIDSGSDDGTPEVAQRAGALVRGIDRRQFHHARTRNEALPLARFDRVVYMVQDAVPCGRTWLADLEKALMENDVAAVYAEQVPHRDAAPYARFETASIQYGRGQEPVVHALESREQFLQMPYHEAYRTIGLDNICAIYRKDLLVRTPFPNVDFAEDLAWAFKSLLMGHRIMYQPGIKVMHSHDRSPEYAFRRQVVNSFWCAKIMGRVERDLSFVTADDLPTLSRIVEREIDRLRNEIVGQNLGGSPGIAAWISVRYPLSVRIKGFFSHGLYPRYRSKTRALNTLAQEVGTQIQQIVTHIREEYRVSGKTALMEVLDLAVANVLGRLYGEIYASRVAAGLGDPEIEAIMKPFMLGV